MSWLLAALMPGMLMMSTVAMQRLESVMHGDEPGPANVVAGLEKADLAARDAAEHPERGRLDPLLLVDEPGLPTRPNPVLHPSEFVNRV